MCEKFGAKHEFCRSLLEERGWTEPKSLELHSWCRIILDYPDKFLPVLVDIREEEIGDILKACVNIRHSAVHRRPQDAETILGSLEAGIGLAKMHQDIAVVQHIQNLRTDFQAIIKDIYSQKDVFQDKLRIQLEQISAERARLRQKATEDAKTEVEAYMREAGAKLADCVNSTSQKLASVTEVVQDSDYFSEPDIDKILLEAERTSIVPGVRLSR
ncbi:hypothetical protein BGW36DRAFT_398523 [Talaromyces proteolyticus]|uniref:Uncharacterized protein n=1 Tax=Talaromyces proteolyticus TaxID=1131652 RepID=A0AAD4KL36_9EURO|nr:uncharacterized protein BGW36DRAFT_398523 [Talaromyces proteolyticus]KAH8695238.1 hypothetical protein BGW36DRAFT_398523 [Talaromyces proteolyticus]